MINIRSWGTHCPVLFTTENLDQAQEVVRLFGLGDVWYDTNNDGQKLQALKGKIKDLKNKLSSAEDEVKDLKDELDSADNCDAKSTELSLRTDLSAAEKKLAESRSVVSNLSKHIDLMRSLIHNA